MDVAVSDELGVVEALGVTVWDGVELWVCVVEADCDRLLLCVVVLDCEKDMLVLGVPVSLGVRVADTELVAVTLADALADALADWDGDWDCDGDWGEAVGAITKNSATTIHAWSHKRTMLMLDVDLIAACAARRPFRQ